MRTKIINVRGTSGSGKSTLVTKIMEEYDTKLSITATSFKRKQPIGYRLSHPGRTALYVIGHYETPCGGCDTINGMDIIYELVQEAADAGAHVLFEGLLISAEVNRTLNLENYGELHVIGLDLPLQECLDSVNERRRRKDPNKGPVNPKNTESKWKGTKQSIKRLEDSGVSCEWHNRQTAFERVKELLGVAPSSTEHS